ncbi:hypothetical protein [Cellulomonas sp. B6]|jgi:hypothetical protein|uniref:hypothetical protein n=1 Tax=Cellulomonas sp. B6 TaxID=1295626 RepID=UPI00073AEB3E|nr:hypothetical protein [Cellulomonas sp. B6]KSW29531.1 hypothetical protein ATM99_00415 [Cellulomonas sp. B6]
MSTDGHSLLGVRAARVQATSAQAGAPVVAPSRAECRAERRAHARRTRTPRTRTPRVLALRIVLAGAVHRLAEALAPRPEDLGHPAR